MPSINLLFHVSSALTFAFLIWYLLRLQSKLRTHSQLMACFRSEQKSVLVDWPDTFLQGFCETFGIELEWQRERLPPQRIEREPWVKAHADLAIQSIRCPDAERCVVRVARSRDLESWKSKLEASLQNKLRIEWDLAVNTQDRK